MNPARLVAVGETMALVTPFAGESVVGATEFRVDAGGAESNVAAHVAALGIPTAWFSRVGDDALGRRILRLLSERGVDVSAVVTDPDAPTGLYVKDPGHPVSYYRAGSAASRLGPSDVPLMPLPGAEVLHVSGITAAISASAAEFLDALVATAHNARVTVSFDVNHRPSLWGSGGAAAEVLDALVRRADVVFVGRDEAELLWGTERPSDVRTRFPDTAELIVKDAEHGATAFTDDGEVFEPSEVVAVVDAVGAGDAFAGGYLASRLGGEPVRERLRAGHRRAALTLTTTADSIDEGLPR